MYYSVFIELKDNNQVKNWLNFENKEDVIQKVCTPFAADEFVFNGETIKKSDVAKILIVETVIKQLGNYELVERFIRETQTYGEKFVNEKYPGFFVKDVTGDFIK